MIVFYQVNYKQKSSQIHLKSIYYIVIIVLICSMSGVFGQDTLSFNATDTLPGATDSLKNAQNLSRITLSPDAFSSNAKYGADHKTFYDPRRNLVYLYGNAFVEYEQFSIRNADYIE